MRRKRRDAGRPRGAFIVDAVLTQTLAELAIAGPDGLSVERIARQANVNKTSVYRRWSTREALVSAALKNVLASVSAQVPDTGSLRGDLLGLLDPVAQLLADGAGQALLRVALAQTSASSVAALAATQLTRQAKAPMVRLVARARARGEWRAGVDSKQLVFALVGALIHRVLLEHAPLSKRWLGSLVDLLLNGASPRAPLRS